VRIGTAEIYRQVEQLPEVVESLVVGQDWEADVRVVLFVRQREGLALDESLGWNVMAPGCRRLSRRQSLSTPDPRGPAGASPVAAPDNLV
jgi:acyl-coenzyme A synthetase/AMP-(fatty) acid ligase